MKPRFLGRKEKKPKMYNNPVRINEPSNIHIVRLKPRQGFFIKLSDSHVYNIKSTENSFFINTGSDYTKNSVHKKYEQKFNLEELAKDYIIHLGCISIEHTEHGRTIKRKISAIVDMQDGDKNKPILVYNPKNALIRASKEQKIILICSNGNHLVNELDTRNSFWKQDDSTDTILLNPFEKNKNLPEVLRTNISNDISNVKLANILHLSFDEEAFEKREDTTKNPEPRRIRFVCYKDKSSWDASDVYSMEIEIGNPSSSKPNQEINAVANYNPTTRIYRSGFTMQITNPNVEETLEITDPFSDIYIEIAAPCNYDQTIAEDVRWSLDSSLLKGISLSGEVVSNKHGYNFQKFHFTRSKDTLLMEDLRYLGKARIHCKKNELLQERLISFWNWRSQKEEFTTSKKQKKPTQTYTNKTEPEFKTIKLKEVQFAEIEFVRLSDHAKKIKLESIKYYEPYTPSTAYSYTPTYKISDLPEKAADKSKSVALEEIIFNPTRNRMITLKKNKITKIKFSRVPNEIIDDEIYTFIVSENAEFEICKSGIKDDSQYIEIKSKEKTIFSSEPQNIFLGDLICLKNKKEIPLKIFLFSDFYSHGDKKDTYRLLGDVPKNVLNFKNNYIKKWDHGNSVLIDPSKRICINTPKESSSFPEDSWSIQIKEYPISMVAAMDKRAYEFLDKINSGCFWFGLSKNATFHKNLMISSILEDNPSARKLLEIISEKYPT